MRSRKEIVDRYDLSKFSSEREMKDAVMCDSSLSDFDKLNLVFSVSKETLKNRDPQLYYAILGAMDRWFKSAKPFPYCDFEDFFGVKSGVVFTCGGYFYRLENPHNLQYRTTNGWRNCSQSEVVCVVTRRSQIQVCEEY